MWDDGGNIRKDRVCEAAHGRVTVFFGTVKSRIQ